MMAGEHALTYIFYHPSMEGLANRIASDKAYSSRVRLGRIGWSSFADGFPNLKIDAEDAAEVPTVYKDFTTTDTSFVATIPVTAYRTYYVRYQIRTGAGLSLGC